MATKDDLNRLIDKPMPENKLKDATIPAAIRDKVGLERQQAGMLNGEQVTVQSTDGLFVFIGKFIKS